jgi:uroporphyrinogen-III synthase
MTRSARRRRLSEHLHSAGPRPVLEALIAVEAGQSLDAVLEDFGRIPADIYRAIGANPFL